MLASKLRVALGGGALLAFLGGGARLAHVEVGRTDRQAELTSLREQAAFRQSEAAHAGALQLELSQLRLATSGAAQELQEAQAEVARLDAALLALEDRQAAAERAAADALQAQRDESQRRLTDTEALRAEAQALAEARAVALTRLERALEAVRAEANARQAELEQARSRSARLAADLSANQATLEQTARDLERAVGELDDVETRLAGALSRAQEAERALATLRAAGVNVDRLTGVDPMPDVRAKVVKVDAQATPPVLLVDVGSGAGLAVGDELYVVRDGREVARLSIEEVRERLSSARLQHADRGVRLRPGDLVRSRPVQR
jgi:hypothetical protein